MVQALEANEYYLIQTTQDWVLLEQVEKIFDAYDTDGNGVLDQEEMSRFIREMLQGTIESQSLSDENINRVIAKLDINGDGEIQQEEMLCFLKQILGL